MKNATKYFLGALILITILIWTNLVKAPADQVKNNVGIYFFDIGQGDSALIQKGDYQILIDGGPDDSLLAKLGETMPLWDRKIEMVILTHPHADHLTGLNLVLDRYEIEKIYGTGAIHTSDAYLEFLDIIKNKDLDYQIISIGKFITPFENGKLEFLWPGEKYLGKNIDNLNDSSQVNRFCYFENCILFTGDIEMTGQEEMFNVLDSQGIGIQSEILKIPHHGSRNGLSQELLDGAQSKIAIISAGLDNKFNHPHKETLQLLEQNNIQILRTDQDKDIIFFINELGVHKK